MIRLRILAVRAACQRCRFQFKFWRLKRKALRVFDRERQRSAG